MGRRIALLSVGNWLPNKGVLELLEAFAALPTGHATLHLAGRADVDRPYAARVEARLRAPDLASRVVVHGTLTREEVGRLYGGADVFVLLSYAETYGTVFGEALAAGVPTVGWRSGNLPNLIEDGREGCLVAPGDIAALSATLERLCTDDEWRAELRAAARPTRRGASHVGRRGRCVLRRPQSSRRTPRLNHRTTGPAGSMSMRVTLASSTYIRHAMPSGTSRAHATAALIGLTWVTTTTVTSTAASARSAHAARTRLPRSHQRLAARRRVGHIGSPALPHPLRHCRRQLAVEVAIVQLDPPLVDRDGYSEGLGACRARAARGSRPRPWGVAAQRRVPAPDGGRRR